MKMKEKVKEHLSDEQCKNIKYMAIQITEVMAKVGTERNMEPKYGFAAIGLIHSWLIEMQIVSGNLESAREELDRHKSAILNLLSNKGFK